MRLSTDIDIVVEPGTDPEGYAYAVKTDKILMDLYE